MGGAGEGDPDGEAHRQSPVQRVSEVKHHVERKVRRFAAKQRKRTGFGWKRWSSDVVYGSWGLFQDYQLAYTSANARTARTDP